MPTSAVAVCNYALSHLGVSTEIQSLTERSKEAAACNRFYDQAVDELLRDFPWQFATTFGPLALVTTAPTIEYSYAYRLPANCMRFRRILSGARVDTWGTRVPFRLAQDDQGVLVLCDQPNAQAEWSTRANNPALFPSDFVQCVALYLASLIAPRVTKGDDWKLGDRAFKLYQMRVAAAWANQASELAADQDTGNTFVEARDGSDVASLPFQSAFSATSDASFDVVETDPDAVVP